MSSGVRVGRRCTDYGRLYGWVVLWGVVPCNGLRGRVERWTVQYTKKMASMTTADNGFRNVRSMRFLSLNF
eukprot:757351-Hanusia_phi.AAC.2